MNANARTKQTIKFLKWTKKYSGWWLLICGYERAYMNLNMMQMLIKRLANEEFMKSVNESLLKDLLVSEWQNGNKDDIVKKLIAYLE